MDLREHAIASWMLKKIFKLKSVFYTMQHCSTAF